MSPYLAVGLTLLPLVGAAIVDAMKGEIPDAFPLALLAWAIVGRSFGWLDGGWPMAALGLAIGLGLGLLFFSLGAMGGGDGKLFAALGAVVAWPGFLVVLCMTALFGGVLALLHRLRGAQEVRYGPAILLGYIGAVFVSFLVRRA